MGLDMYLHKRTYVKNWNFMGADERHQITVKKAKKKHPHIQTKRICYIVEEIGYWRKANQIHQWFVEHTQGGVDRNGEETYVEHSQLQELLDTCILVRDNAKLKDGNVEHGYTFDDKGKKVSFLKPGKVLVNTSVAKELLPTTSGFFFGGTDYDQYYMEDILNTIEILETELNTKNENGNYTGDVYYRSSW